MAQVRVATLVGCAGFCIATIAANAGRLIETAPLDEQRAPRRPAADCWFGPAMHTKGALSTREPHFDGPVLYVLDLG
jgi:hypothetical protein